jgi:hypothetical protein
MSDLAAPKDWFYYRQQAIGLQQQLAVVEKKIQLIWDQAIRAAANKKRAAWYVILKNETTEHGYEFSTLKGERTLLLEQITAAATMSIMLYQQGENA